MINWFQCYQPSAVGELRVNQHSCGKNQNNEVRDAESPHTADLVDNPL